MSKQHVGYQKGKGKVIPLSKYLKKPKKVQKKYKVVKWFE